MYYNIIYYNTCIYMYIYIYTYIYMYYNILYYNTFVRNQGLRPCTRWPRSSPSRASGRGVRAPWRAGGRMAACPC